MTDVVRACRKSWRRLGVPSAVAEEMAAELEAELGEAAADGVTPESFVGGDARSFAAQWAYSRGVVRSRARVLVTVLAAVVGAIPGTSFALFVAYGGSSEAFQQSFPGIWEYLASSGSWLLIVLYGLGALFAYAGAVGAVAGVLRWRDDPAAVATARILAASLPFGTAAAIGLTMALGWTQDFSTSASVVLAEALLATIVFATAAASARFLAVRSPTATPAAAG